MEEIKISVTAYKELIDDNIALTKEKKLLYEELDDKQEIIQSLHDEIEARNCYTKKVIAERNRLQEEINVMGKDHEDECKDFIKMINERIDIDTLHMILAKYLTDKYTFESTKIHFFQFLDEIKKYIDNKKE